MKVKTDVQNIIRDTETGALLNTDMSGLEAYKKNKIKNFEINILKKDMNSLKNEINEIKNLLNKIAEKI